MKRKIKKKKSVMKHTDKDQFFTLLDKAAQPLPEEDAEKGVSRKRGGYSGKRTRQRKAEDT